MNHRPIIVVYLTALILAGSWLVFVFVRAGQRLEHSKDGVRQIRALTEQQDRLTARGKSNSTISDAQVTAIVSQELRQSLADALIERLQRMMLAHKRVAIEGEAILTFAHKEAFLQFLDRMGEGESAVRVLRSIDALRVARLAYDQLEDLRNLLATLEDEEIDLASNFLVQIPAYPIPDPGSPLPGSSGGARFGNSALPFIGIANGENARWGRGVRVAVLDSGVAEHPTFREGQVEHIGASITAPVTEAGENVVADGHGTAVASIIGGNHPRTPGVAPQAEILSFQLLDETGSGDSFTLAQMIFDAVGGGADIINLSIGSYGDSQFVHDMVDFAISRGVLIVASTGNDAAQSIVFPAAYEGVIAVGAVDARGEHLEFSNASDLVDLAAPGLAVAAAWPNGQRVEFSGTSASAPFVSGAIAAVMSENPDLTATQAWNLLQRFTNEAGAPGIDPQLGRGNLNIGRLMERDQPGIYDLAITSHHLDLREATPGSAHHVQVTMQNRGTQALSNVALQVTASGRSRDFYIPSIRPGQIASRAVSLNQHQTTSDGHVLISSIATLSANRQDRTPGNNFLKSNISISPPAAVAK